MCQLVLEISQLKFIFLPHKHNAIFMILSLIPIKKKSIEKNDLILIMTPEKQDKTLELSKHWYPVSTLRNKVIMKSVTKSVVIIN